MPAIYMYYTFVKRLCTRNIYRSANLQPMQTKPTVLPVAYNNQSNQNQLIYFTKIGRYSLTIFILNFQSLKFVAIDYH